MRLNGALGALALGLAMAAVPARAQFTAVVTPPPARVDSTAAVRATVTAERDSAARITMTNMQEWVDSAAATLGARVDSVPVDTAALRPEPVVPPPVPPPVATTEEFREGAPAPATATGLPLIALSGALLMACGLWLRRRACTGSSRTS